MYYLMKILKWDSWFEPDVEITIGVAWILLPNLPSNFVMKEAIFSIESMVGKLLTVDLETRSQTRPSCVKIKIEFDLVTKLPQRVRIN